jgi:hypothetical protein
MTHKRFTFCLVGLLLLMSLMSEVLIGQDSQQDFTVFFAKFKSAVAHKDAATLTTLMMPSFNFIHARNVSPPEVFKGLDANGGLQWTNLQQSVQGDPSPYQTKGTNTSTRVLQCKPTEIIYSCLVTFQRDHHHRWRWKSMIMPTR